MPEIDDLQPTEIAGLVARATPPAAFGDLLARAHRRRRVLVAGVAAAVLVLAGGAASVAALVSNRPSTPAFVSPGPVPPASCRSDVCLHIPRGSQRMSRAVGDFDGDGKADTFVVYAYPMEHGLPIAWNAQVNLANGRILHVTLPQNHNEQDLVAGVVDANHDGRSEAFVRVWSGAADEFYQIYGISGGRLTAVRFADGQAVRLDVGGSVLSGGGARCVMTSGSPTFVITSFGPSGTRGPGPNRPQWQRTTYAWRGDVLHAVGQSEGTLGMGMHAAEPYQGFDCFGQTLAALPHVVPIPPYR